jgi:hypothetical protein
MKCCILSAHVISAASSTHSLGGEEGRSLRLVEAADEVGHGIGYRKTGGRKDCRRAERDHTAGECGVDEC